MRTKKTRPVTLTDFRRLGRKLLGDRTAKDAKILHNKREALAVACAAVLARPSLIAWIRRGRTADLLPANVRLIPLGGGYDIKPTSHRQAQNWEPSEAAVSTEAEATNHGRYSSGCTWTRWSYRQRIESWGAVANGCFYFRVQTDTGLVTRLLRPWRGWRWTIDVNGIVLRDSAGRRDYHPTAGDLITPASTAHFAAIARAADCARRETAKAARETTASIRRAEREGCFVCLSDSLAAGNCRAGTENWATRHGLAMGQHYAPTSVLALANGDTDRVQLVVTKALARHRQEMRQGYADLAYHCC